jgi:tetratricopeptide (TPR) repeat protein
VRSLVGSLAGRGAFDPFLPLARALEQRIGDGRFGDALPLAKALERAHPREPQIAFWLARIHHGLHDAESEAAAWERYVELSPAPAEACPALPEAYAAAHQPGEALRGYERCAAFDETDVQRLVDLGDAYAKANRPRDAFAQFERTARLDPDDSALASRLTAFRDPDGGGQ